MATILPLVQKVNSLTKNAKNIDTALINCEPELKKINAILKSDLNNTDLMVFSWLIQFSIDDNSSHTLNEIVKHLGTKKSLILEILPVFEKLKKQNLIHKNSTRNDENPKLSDLSYYVSYPMITALNQGEIFKPEVKQVKAQNNVDFIKRAQKFFTDRDYENISNDQMEIRLVELFKSNRNLQIVKSIEDLFKTEGVELEDTSEYRVQVDVSTKFFMTPIYHYAFVIKLILNSTEGNFKFTTKDVLSYLTQDTFDTMFDEDYINSEEYPLAQLKLISNLGSGAERSDVLLFDFDNKLLNYCLGEEAKGLLKLSNNSLFINPEDIKPKELYFNSNLDNQLAQISKIISQDKFNAISNGLVNKFNSNAGVCILLEGGPGSGKTEFAMQLARNSGRPIYKVDISEQKGAYLGDSERNIKRLFTNYKTYCKFSDVKPIMLLNESDAIFSKRIQVKNTVDQTMNAIQNIILDELDTFEGILIATTNLMENFDSAFERRLLMKVKFENPEASVRSKIWKNKLSQLEQPEVDQLSQRFELTPAQIENVSKKLMFKEILEEDFDANTINELCEAELGVTKRTSVGYQFGLQNKLAS